MCFGNTQPKGKSRSEVKIGERTGVYRFDHRVAFVLVSVCGSRLFAAQWLLIFFNGIGHWPDHRF